MFGQIDIFIAIKNRTEKKIINVVFHNKENAHIYLATKFQQMVRNLDVKSF